MRTLRIQFANKEFVALVELIHPYCARCNCADALHIPELIGQFALPKNDETAKLTRLYPFGVSRSSSLDSKVLITTGHSQSFQAVLFEDVSDLLRLSNDIEQKESLYRKSG